MRKTNANARFQPRALAAAIALLAVPTLPAMAQDNADQPPAVDQAEQTYAFDIPAQPLARAITDFSAVTGVQVLYTEQAKVDHTAPALQGNYTVNQALQRLLAGTGVNYRFTGENSVTLEVAQNGDGPLRLAPINVEAPSDYIAESSSLAMKTGRPLIETPQHVSVVTEQVIAEQDKQEMQDFFRNVPGVQDSNGNRDFNIRGFRSNDQSSIVFDGKKGLPGSFRYHPKTFSMERVEVQKGPSSLFQGQVNPGGVVNLVPKGPQKQRTNKLKTVQGDYDEAWYEGEHTGLVPGFDNLSYRFDWRFGEEESFVENLKDERLMIAPSLEWEISDHQTLTLIARVVDEDGSGRRRRGVPDVEGDFSVLPIGFTVNEPTDFVNHDVQWMNVDYVNSLPGFSALEFESGFRFTHSKTDEEYHEPRGAPTFDDDTIPRQFRDSNSESYGLYHESFVNWEPADSLWGIKHHVTFGYDFFYQDFENTQSTANPEGTPATDFIPILNTSLQEGTVPPIQAFSPQFRQSPGRPQYKTDLIIDTEGDSREFGVYLQNELEFSESLKGLFGVRWDHFDQDEVAKRFRAGSRSSDDDNLSFRGALRYKMSGQSNSYFSYSESFEPQGLTTQTSDDGPFDPEESRQFELGHKAKWLDGSLNSTVSVFSITKENVVRTDPNDINRSVAIGEVESKGVEVELQGNITPRLSLTANYAFIDAEVTDAGADSINEGEVPDIQADQTAAVWLRYQFPESFGFWVAGGPEWSNEFETNDPTDATPGSFVVLDLAAGLEPVEGFKLQINLNNVTDRRFFRGGFGGRAGWEPGAPRTVSITGSYQF